MNDMFRNLTMVLAGGLCLGGCARPIDPPASETFGAALDSVQHVNAGPGDKPKDSEQAKKDKDAAEDAKIEKRIRAMAHYAAGVAHRERGELKEATEEFYQAALADPSDKKVVTEVIQMLLVTRQQAKIFQLLVQATKDPNATAELHALLAAAYLERKKPDMAKLAAENAIRRDPKAIEGYKSLVQAQRALHKEAGKRKKAIRSTIDRALKQTKTSVPFQVDLAMMLLGYLDLDKDAGKELKPKAAKLLESAWDSKPKEPLVLERIARGFRLAGVHDKAALAMEALLDKLPNNPAVLLEAARGQALAGKLDKAKLHLNALVKKFPRYWQGHQLLAAVAMDQEEYKDAVKHYRAAIKLNPRVEQMHYDLVSALLSSEQVDEAAAELKKIAARFKVSFQQLYFAAMIHLQKDEFAEAHEDLLKTLEFAEKNSPERVTHFLQFQLGSTAERAGNFKAAEKYMRKAIAMKPDYATALNYLGYMWADRNENLDEAEKFIARALKEQPDNAAFLDSMAWVHFRRGNAKEALRWQEKALKNSKEDDAELLMHLGEIHAALKNTKKAREFLEKAAKVEDAREEILEKIKAKLKALDK